jgi:hypothetical protein
VLQKFIAQPCPVQAHYTFPGCDSPSAGQSARSGAEAAHGFG